MLIGIKSFKYFLRFVISKLFIFGRLPGDKQMEDVSMMKSILLATTLFTGLLSSPAFADELPKEILGMWCGDGYYLEDQTKKCPDAGWIKFKPDGYDAWEYSCRYVSIENRFDPNIPVATQTLGVPVSRIVADCDDGLNEPDSRWKETFEVYESKGRLYYTDRK